GSALILAAYYPQQFPYAAATASGRGDVCSSGAAGPGLHAAAHGATDDDRAAAADGHHHGPAVTDGHDDVAASAHE
ncbi:hypothetical protein, partial [Mycobacterium intracellulare]|uniref:hypothetical protein n=1 Tax=Mycobacterium intracellulare TaxID=1767 RepID=UPI000A54CECD